MGAVSRILIYLPGVLLLIPSTDAVYSCSIYGDPHLVTYKGARATILIPCRFRATHFVVKISGQDKWCETNIYAFGRVHEGGVYTGGAEIEISIYGLQGTVQTNITSTAFLITDDFLRGPLSNLIWGQPVNLTLDVATIIWTFNTAGAILNVPACGLSLVYRLRSARPSGIVISVSDDATISPGYKNNAFCGSLNDTSSTLIEDALQLQLHTPEQVLAYRFGNLTDRQYLVFTDLTPELHPNYYSCISYYPVISLCGNDEALRSKSMGTCLDMLQKRRLLKCLYKGGEKQPFSLFLYCLYSMCLPADSSFCRAFKNDVETCKEDLTPRLRQMYESSTCSLP